MERDEYVTVIRSRTDLPVFADCVEILRKLARYDGINVEDCRYRCGAALARNDNVEADYVTGIPDSGIGHAMGYANEKGIPHKRPYVKYTPTWPRSFMPQNQEMRDLVARMKLIPIKELIKAQPELKKRIASMADTYEVTFLMCDSGRVSNKLPKEAIYDFVKMVPNAAIGLMDKQHEGFGYIPISN